MLQVRIHGPDDVRIDEIAVPVAGPDDIVMRVGACGICGSDLSYIQMGGMPGGSSGAMALGHEFAGTVQSVGDSVNGITAGQRVVVDPMNADNLGNGGPEGAFAPCVLVRNARLGHNVHLLPDGMSFERAALVEPLSVALHAVHTGIAVAQDKVVIYGAGCIGLGAVVALRHLGVRDIAVIDLSDERLRRAAQLGATLTINPTRQNALQELVAAHGAADVYGMPATASTLFIDAAGTPAVFEEIVRITAVGARVVVVALYKKPASIDLQLVLMKELSIKGSIGYPNEFPAVIEMLSDRNLDVTPVVSHRFALAQFHDALRTARDTHGSAKVMVSFES